MINYRLNDDIAYLEMDDGKANVFSIPMSRRLRELLSRAQDEAKATVIVGRDRQFSAGYDLSVMQSGDAKAMAAMVVEGFEMLCQLAAHPQPTLAACNGNAMGLGAFILLVSDTRIGADIDCKISLPETRGGMQFVPLLVTAAKARLSHAKYIEAALQSQIYSPSGAVEAGFLDQVVNADQLLEHTTAVAQTLMQLPGATYARNKQDLLASKLKSMQKNLAEIKANPMILA